MHQVVNELLSAAGEAATDMDGAIRVSSQVTLGAQRVADYDGMTDIRRIVQVRGYPEAGEELLIVRLTSGINAPDKRLGVASGGIDVLFWDPSDGPQRVWLLDALRRRLARILGAE